MIFYKPQFFIVLQKWEKFLRIFVKLVDFPKIVIVDICFHSTIFLFGPDKKPDFWLLLFWMDKIDTGCPKKHGNSVTNSISSLSWISIVIPNFKIHNIIMSARVYFMKRVKDCKYVSIMSPQDEQWRRTSLLCLHTAIFLIY